jgi:DNA-binding response OmpR family regulator
MRNSEQKPSETILVVEDDQALRDGLVLNLRLEGYGVLAASDGNEGVRMAFEERPDLIVLDIMMPGLTGLDILEELREQGERVPVLILSARDTTLDKVEGLKLGADDYLSKPFDLPELLARIEVMLRRQRETQASLPDLEFGDVVIHQSTRQVSVASEHIDLSAKEFEILCLLASSPGQVFTRGTILQRVWGWGYEGTERTVDNFVANLRRKLSDRDLIKTVPREGYRFESC